MWELAVNPEAIAVVVVGKKEKNEPGKVVLDYLNGGTWSLRKFHTPSDFFSKYFGTSQKNSGHLRKTKNKLRNILGYIGSS